MKRLALTLILSLLLITPAGAAPDLAKVGTEVDAAQRSIDKANAEAAALKASRDSLSRTLDASLDQSAKKDAMIEWQAKAITDRDGWLVQANSLKWTLLCMGVGVLGIGFIAAGSVGWVLNVGRSAAKCLAIGVPLLTLSAGMIWKYQEYAAYGIAMGLLISLGGICWIINDIREHKEAGVENGNLIPLAEASGKFTPDQIATLEQLAYAEGNKLADKLRAEAAGISPKQLVERFKVAVGITKKATA